ncbi:MAG: hypothetical protein D3920_13020 [Candidatus Electrothrix sp. AW2]|nr:hypothetical protein [Candidatus Electrothrix gigas]
MGFRMLTVLLGFNPINKRSVDRNAANLLRALIELIPGGALITQALDNHGVINKAAAWVEQKVATLGNIGSDIVDSLKRFLDSLGWRDIFDLGDVWERGKRILTNPISRLINFGITVGTELIRMVKDALLKPLAALAKGTKGYDLLCALLGEDPITSKPVPRNAETLIGGFMKLIGREDLWKNLKKANAVPRAWAWFQKTWVGLLAFAHSIPGRITATLDALTPQDILTIAGAFKKVVGTFAGIAGEFISWGLKQVVSLLEILFSGVAPSVMPYLKKAKGAFVTILKNPIGFAGNLVRAGKLGFQMFAGNILKHLKKALIKWITGPLGKAGVYIPKSFSLMEIIKLVLSVLGLTWQNIRQKLVKIIPDPILTGLEKTAGVLVTLVKDGPVAAWKQIKAELTQLKDQLISQVTEMVTTKVVQAAVTKLGTMLNPAGAVIQSIISIYNTITFFIERAGQMASVVGSFINSISAIAAGRVKNAATRVEQTMAKTLNVVLAFLANFAGLDNIPRKIVAIIQKIRKPIDKGMDKILAWLVKTLKNLVKKGKAAIVSWWKKKAKFQAGGETHSVFVETNTGPLMVATDKKPVAKWLEEQHSAGTAVSKLKPVETALINAEDERNKASKAAKDANEVAQANYEKSITALGKALADSGAFGDTVLPPTVVSESTTTTIQARNPKTEKIESSTTGSKMVAKPLTMLPAKQAEYKGSRPDGKSMWWKDIRKHRPGVYVQGHLLNDNIHGPGIAKNLAPITGKFNNPTMLNAIEKNVKKTVSSKKVVEYDVQVSYKSESQSSHPNASVAELHLPTTWKMTAWELDTKDNNADKSKPESWTKRVRNIASFHETDPNTNIDASAGDTRPDINAGTSRLKDAGLNNDIAVYLPKVRIDNGRNYNFKNFDDLKIKVQEYAKRWRKERDDSGKSYSEDQIGGTSWVNSAIKAVESLIDKKIREPGET